MNENMQTKSFDIHPEKTTFVPVSDDLRTPSVERLDKFLSPKEGQEKREYYESIFDKYDKDKTGFIELGELEEMIENDNDIPKYSIKNVFDMSDRNHDDRIDHEEFVKMIQNRKLKVLFGRYVDTYVRFVLPRKKRHLVSPRETEVDGLYEDHYSCCPPPIMMVLISALELACFITDETTQKDSTVSGSGVTARLFIYDPYQREQCWRFLTYMMVHIGYVHLVVNLLVQLFLGIPLEMIHSWRVVIVYIAGVITGSLCTSITDPTTYLAGASGGVYALITAHIASIILNWNEMTFPFVQLIIYLIISFFDLVTSIYNRYWLELEDHIGYAAHFGGALAGLLVGIWTLKNFIPSRKETYLWWITLVVYIIIIGTMILLNIFWPNHFLKLSK